MGGPFTGARFHRVLSVPGRSRDEDRATLAAALTAAHAELSTLDDGLVVAAWQRPAAGAPVRVLVGGRPRFPPAGPAGWPPRSTGALLYPPGSTGTDVDTDEVVAGWRQMPDWIACAGRLDPLWTSTVVRGGFAECLVHLTTPFVWLVWARPARPGVLDDELADLTTRIPMLRRRENSELDCVELERAQDRYRELSRAAAIGTWTVRVAVGGPSPAASRRVAALMCAASDLGGQPYVLVPRHTTTPFDRLDPPELHATSELLAALTAPPRRELPGIRVVEPARFDLTPENHDGILLGHVLDDADQPVGDFRVGTDTLNRHTFVTGATGAGKSRTVRHLLTALHRAGIPWLVIEPAKAEYGSLAGSIGPDRLAVLRPGAPDAVPCGLNPLAPEPGFPLATHIDLVRALFLAAFEATEPFPQVLASALVRCYTALGWDTTLGTSRLPHATPRYPTLDDLRDTALRVVRDIGYGREVADNVRGFVDIRIGSLLLGTPGRFFAEGNQLDLADLVRHNVVLQIEDIGNDQDSAFLIGAVLIRLHEHLRVHRDSGGGLRHVTVVEEAHRLLKRVEPGSPAAHAVELFTALLAEIRAYGEGIVVAEQIPAKIVPDVVKNTALKIVHRLPAEDDRAVVGATMNLDAAQSRHVVALPPGRAAVFADGMDRPIRVQVPFTVEDAVPPTGRVATGPAMATCPPGCACTLRESTASARLAEDPELALWVELMAAAHVLGYPEPLPRRSWLDRFAATDRHRLDCAVAQLATGAVRRRYVALLEYYQPEQLARHLADRARAHLTRCGEDAACDGSEVCWQAGLYRWRDVFVAFTRADYDPDRPHPLTARWRARGLDLTDAPAREQLLNLRRLPSSRTTDRTAVDGAGDPPEHRRLSALLSSPAEPMRRFVEATRFLTFSNAWPLHRLYPEEWAASRE